MRTRSKKKWIKIVQTGRVSVFRDPHDPRRFEVSWKRRNGSYGRRRFQARSTDEAIDRAPVVAGLEQDPSWAGEGLEIGEAFGKALAETRRNPRSRKDWLREQVRFMEWLEKHFPDCAHWNQISRVMLREYLASVFPDCSANRRRLAMQPIIQTSGFMAREYQIPNVSERMNIGSKLVKTPPMVYLADVLDLVDWLRANAPEFEAGAALQGLAGLQLQEATRLTWNKINLDEGLIEISGEVKNVYRNRVLPVCDRVKDALRRADERRSSSKVADLSETVLIDREGLPYDRHMNAWMSYSHALKYRLKLWNHKIEWTPKDLRNCLPTFAAMEGLLSDVWEQYLGHAPRSITARHYIPRLASGSIGESHALKRQMEVFKLHVTRPLESAIQRNGTAEILNIFEREGENPPEAAEADRSEVQVSQGKNWSA